MSKIFENNIKALIKKDEILASKLFSIKTNENFEVVQQGDDPINLNIIDKKRGFPIYKTNPLEEIEKKRKEFKKYQRYPVLFQYGIGNGIFTKLLFANPSHQHVIVYEPNLEILYIALNIVDFSQEIEEEKIKFFNPLEYRYAQAIKLFENPDIQVFSKIYQLHIYSEYYEKFYSDNILEINKINLRAIKQAVNNLGNSSIDTLIGIEHHIKNTPEMIKNMPFKKFALKNKNKYDYAVIVATGPSLEKQLPILKEIQDYVTIISVDASMPILEKWGIKPDVVASLERVEATSAFFKNTSKEFQKEIIMLHSSLQHEEVLKHSYGIKSLPMRPFYFTKYLNLSNYGFIGIGMSAANMAYEFAYILGIKNIILIGQDLAYSKDGKSHAKNHVLGEDEVKFKETDEYVPAYGGDGLIRTTKVWNMFRNFFERDIYISSQEGFTTYNATEGGARIEGAIEIPFKEIVKKIPKKRKKPLQLVKPTQKQIDTYLIKAHKKYSSIYEYGGKIQKRIEKLFLQVAKECEKLEKLKDENKLDKINYDRLVRLSNKIDKIKSKIETKSFYSQYGEVVQSSLMHQEMELAKIQVAPSDTEIEKKAKLIDWIMKHKYWLFELAGTINAERIVIKRAIPNLENELKKRGLEFNPLQDKED